MPVIQKGVLDIIILVRRINDFSILFLDMIFLSIFWAYILALRVYFIQLSGLFLKPVFLLWEFILDESLIYFSNLHRRFVSPFWSSLLSIFPILHPRLTKSILFKSLFFFQSYILALRVYFIQVSCLFFKPTSLLRGSIFVDSFSTFLSYILALRVYI